MIDPVEPVIRVRAHHKRTLKSGWQLDESTVEFASPIGPMGDVKALGPLLRGLLDQVYQEGVAESLRRNALESVQPMESAQPLEEVRLD